MTPQVIDLSHHNRVTDLAPARAAGVVGIIHKASQGVANRDEKLEARHFLAGKAGMMFGVYHWLEHGNVANQFDNFCQAADLLIDSRTLIAVDHEDDATLDELLQFLGMIERKFKRSPVIYSGHLLKEQMLNASINQAAEISDYRLWLAQYADKPELPHNFMHYWLWQYSKEGKVTGLIGYTDISIFGGNVPTISEWSGVSAPAEPVKAAEPITITVTVPKGTKVKIVET